MPTLRKVWRQGNSWVVSLPEHMIEMFHLSENPMVKVDAYPGQMITVTPMGEKEIAALKAARRGKGGV
jgi:antitoxin component of MazEF toxin-antitoxin module